MTAKDVRNRFKGVFGFPITPFRKDLSLDLDGLERNVADMVRHPFCGLVAAGGTGELYSVPVEEIVGGRPAEGCRWWREPTTMPPSARRLRARRKKPARIACWRFRPITSMRRKAA